MESLWIILSLISAFSLATSDAFTKRALRLENEYLIAWLRLILSLPLLIVLLLIIPSPSVDSTFYMAFISALPLEILALTLYIKALRVSPMSLSLPFLSLTPFFLILFSRLILGEHVTLLGAAGIFFIVIGGYSLNISSQGKDPSMPLTQRLLEPLRAIGRERGSIYMISVAIIYSITSSLGKLAILHSSPLYFGATYFISLTICFTPLVWLNLRNRPLASVLMTELRHSLLPGLFYSLMIITHMLAISMAEAAYMIAIKRSSLLIGSIYGFVLFRERNVLERLSGAILMFTGFLLIVLGR